MKNLYLLNLQTKCGSQEWHQHPATVRTAETDRDAVLLAQEMLKLERGSDNTLGGLLPPARIQYQVRVRRITVESDSIVG